MSQIVFNGQKPVYCNIDAIRNGGSQANTIIADGAIWLVSTTNGTVMPGTGLYDSYIKGDGEKKASELPVLPIDSGSNIPRNVVLSDESTEVLPPIDFDAASDTVWTKQQLLSDNQKETARNNIGAAGVDDIYQIPYIYHEASDNNVSLTPNALHVWGVVESLTIRLDSGIPGIINEYLFQFESGNTPTTLIVPDEIEWIQDPVIKANKKYEVSIVNGLAGLLTTDMVSAGIQVETQSDWTETDTTSAAYIKHKPEIPQTSAFMRKIAVVNHGTSDTTFAITPNTFHVWGEVGTLNITLDTSSEESGVVNEYMFQFSCGSSPASLTYPSTIKWVTEPNIAANSTYQVSIINNIAVIGGVSDE